MKYLHTMVRVADLTLDPATGYARGGVLPVGGRRHIDKGNPCDVDAELWTTLLDDRVAYDPAEMLCVVEAGMRIHDLRMILAEGGQEWPVDAPDDATATRDAYLIFLERFKDNVAASLRAVAHAPAGGVVVHCVGGKDRTGLLTAFLLHLAAEQRDGLFNASGPGEVQRARDAEAS